MDGWRRVVPDHGILPGRCVTFRRQESLADARKALSGNGEFRLRARVGLAGTGCDLKDLT